MKPPPLRSGRRLGLGLGLLLGAVSVRADLMVDTTGQFFRLSGGESVRLFDGTAAGAVGQIDISFFFSPADEFAQGDSRASDFSLVVIAPGQTPQQWGGADIPFQALYPGATHEGDWSFHGAGSGGPGNFDKTYSDSVMTSPAGLSGDGEWQIFIMNGYGGSHPVNYQDVKITLHDLAANVPEEFGRWGMFLCLLGVWGLLASMRTRASAA